MPVERFFCHTPLRRDTTVSLTDKEFHHFAHVIKGQEGDSVELIDGKGALAIATVTTVKKNQAALHIKELNISEPPSFKIILAQAVPRTPRLDFILEKGTELGATDFWLFPGDRSERLSLSEHHLLRMQTITISALKQCGRLYLPNLIAMPKLKEWKMPAWTMFYGDTNPDAPWFYDAIEDSKMKKGIIFCIGPESGLSDSETKALQSMGAIGVKLNDFILRTDTAALSALSLISQYFKS